MRPDNEGMTVCWHAEKPLREHRVDVGNQGTVLQGGDGPMVEWYGVLTKSNTHRLVASMRGTGRAAAHPGILNSKLEFDQAQPPGRASRSVVKRAKVQEYMEHTIILAWNNKEAP